jgi:hypothetical protein
MALEKYRRFAPCNVCSGIDYFGGNKHNAANQSVSHLNPY